MFYTKTRTAAELRQQAEALRQRAAKAETDATSERSAAAGAFADEREDDAQAALTRAAQLTAEAASLKLAAEEIETRASAKEAEERLERHVQKVSEADKLTKAARDQIAKLVPRIVRDLRTLQESGAAAEFASNQAQFSANELSNDAPAPLPFSTPSVFVVGPASPGRLADQIEFWATRE